jgi:hypothetical protein
MAKAQLTEVNFAISIVVIAAVAAAAAYFMLRVDSKASEDAYGSDLPQQQTGEVPNLHDELKRTSPLPGIEPAP